MPQVLTLVEQFWHKVPGGTARATERTLAALLDRNEFSLTGLAAAHRSPSAIGDPGCPGAPGRWTQVPSGVSVHHHWMPRPVLYESWLRVGRPSIDRWAEPQAVFWASSLIVAPTRCPVVSTVHDLDFLDTPELLSRRGRDFFPRMWHRARVNSDRFVCPSQVVAEQCVRHGAEENLIRVVPWGVDRPTCPAPDVDGEVNRLLEQVDPEIRQLPDPFVLLVAPDQARKNPQICAQAVAANGCATVIVGSGPAPGQPDHFAGLETPVIRVGSVSDRQLSALYQRARVLLFPSLAEGFGLPVAEAMAHRLPVITSAGTATEEVAGGAAIVVDPTDEDHVTQALKEVLSDNDVHQELVSRGLARASELTWDKTAEGYSEIFREVL